MKIVSFLGPEMYWGSVGVGRFEKERHWKGLWVKR